MKALYETRQEKKAALDQAQQAMDTAERYSVSDDTRQYITDRAKYQQQMDQAEQNMLQLTVLKLRKSRREFTTPRRRTRGNRSAAAGHCCKC